MPRGAAGTRGGGEKEGGGLWGERACPCPERESGTQAPHVKPPLPSSANPPTDEKEAPVLLQRALQPDPGVNDRREAAPLRLRHKELEPRGKLRELVHRAGGALRGK